MRLLTPLLLAVVLAVTISAESAVEKHRAKAENSEVKQQREEEERKEGAEGKKGKEVELLPSCSEFNSCAECVFDATLGLMTEYANCTWCPSEKKCVDTAKDSANMCKGGQFLGGPHKPQCKEMQCVAAEDWTNLYFCRPWSRAVLCLAVILGLFSFLFYYWWLRAIAQKPWKYPRLHDVVDNHVSNSFLSEMRTGETAEAEEAHHDNDDAESEADAVMVITCQICKVRSPSCNGDAVCTWCNIARLSFMPLIVAVTTSATILILIFLVGLKPWFADWYYFFLLVVGFGAYFVFFYQVWNNRGPIVGDPERRLSSFIHLALTLRGRKLLDVFPNVEDVDNSPVSRDDAEQVEMKVAAPAAATAGGRTTPPVASNPLNTSITNTSITMPSNTSFSALRDVTYEMKYASAIPEYMKSVIDEHVDPIVWSYEPDRTDIIADNIWLLHFFASLAFIGFWMMCANMVDPTWTMWKITSHSLLMGVGVTFMMFGSYFLLHTYNSTVKYYVMTKKNLYAFSQNGSGAVHHATPIEFVRCASIQTYACYGQTSGMKSDYSRVIQSFSWTAPMEGRRMPSITAKHFVGLPAEALMELRTQFTKYVNININSDAIKDDFAHLRTAWKLHISVQLLLLYLLPIFLFHSYMMPSSFAFFGCLAFGSVPLCFLYRGWRIHKLTVVGHNVAKENFFWKHSQRAAQGKKTLKGITTGLIASKRMASLLKMSKANTGKKEDGSSSAEGGAAASPSIPELKLENKSEE